MKREIERDREKEKKKEKRIQSEAGALEHGDLFN